MSFFAKKKLYTVSESSIIDISRLACNASIDNASIDNAEQKKVFIDRMVSIYRTAHNSDEYTLSKEALLNRINHFYDSVIDDNDGVLPIGQRFQQELSNDFFADANINFDVNTSYNYFLMAQEILLNLLKLSLFIVAVSIIILLLTNSIGVIYPPVLPLVIVDFLVGCLGVSMSAAVLLTPLNLVAALGCFLSSPASTFTETLRREVLVPNEFHV